MININDLRKKSVKELREELVALLKEQFNLRCQATDEAPRSHRFKEGRRNIARIKTLLKEKAGA